MVDLVMPKLGESIMEATILKWVKKPGDKVEQDETILEIATDKVDSEVPSTANGVIAEILYKENDVNIIGMEKVPLYYNPLDLWLMVVREFLDRRLERYCRGCMS